MNPLKDQHPNAEGRKKPLGSETFGVPSIKGKLICHNGKLNCRQKVFSLTVYKKS